MLQAAGILSGKAFGMCQALLRLFQDFVWYLQAQRYCAHDSLLDIGHQEALRVWPLGSFESWIRFKVKYTVCSRSNMCIEVIICLLTFV